MIDFVEIVSPEGLRKDKKRGKNPLGGKRHLFSYNYTYTEDGVYECLIE